VRVAEDNLVVYSTHSIFMIDPANIGRHLIVKKQNEVTSFKQAKRSNIFDEEVLYNALGCSVFDSLKDKNLLFEGWRDKRLLEVALSRVPKKHQGCKLLKEHGQCFAAGVKNVPSIAALVQLANRLCVVVTDCDDVALEKQRHYVEAKGFAEWITYVDLLPDTDAKTAEDFIKPEILEKTAKRIEKDESLSSAPDFATAGAAMDAVDRWLKNNGKSGADLKGLKNQFKESVFQALKQSHITDEYYEFLVALASKIG